jgi:hypothetical protein
MPARRKPKSQKQAANSPKRGRGRPSDYKPEICAMVAKLALLGLTDAEMADVIGKPMRTFDTWKAIHPEFQQAIKGNKRPANGDVAVSLFERAKGYEWQEQQAIKVKEIRYSETGKKISEIERVEVVTITRKAPPDTMACMYWLNNRERDSGNWRQKVDVEHGGKGGGPIILYRDDEGL